MESRPWIWKITRKRSIWKLSGNKVPEKWTKIWNVFIRRFLGQRKRRRQIRLIWVWICTKNFNGNYAFENFLDSSLHLYQIPKVLIRFVSQVAFRALIREKMPDQAQAAAVGAKLGSTRSQSHDLEPKICFCQAPEGFFLF